MANRTTKTANRMRSWLYSIARKRNSGIVTADDAHTYMDRAGISQSQVFDRLSLVNSVLREPYFVTKGITASERPAARGRAINAWSM